jgi:hypothetical protein
MTRCTPRARRSRKGSCPAAASRWPGPGGSLAGLKAANADRKHGIDIVRKAALRRRFAADRRERRRGRRGDFRQGA